MAFPEVKHGKLRVLNLEDNPNDSELIQAELETAWDGVELMRVETRDAFVRALDEFAPEVVLSDFNLPDMSGKEALLIVRQTHPYIPVIMVTGALGDIEAVELVKLGARDYVMKDHLQRLTSAVQGALSLEQGIRARKAAEKALRQSEEEIRELVERSPVAMIVDVGAGTDEQIVIMNRHFTDLFGYTIDDVPDINHWWRLAYPDDRYREKLQTEWTVSAERACRTHGEIEPRETSVTCKDGSLRYVRTSFVSIGSRNIVTFEDLTQRKNLEDALKEAVDRNRAITETANDAIICINPDGIVYLWNKKAEEMFGYAAAEVIGRNLHELVTPQQYIEQATEALQRYARTGHGPIVGTTRQLTARRKDGSEFPIELSVSAMNIHGEWHATGIIRDITERKQAELLLRDSEEKLRAVFEGALDGIALADAGTQHFYAGNPAICALLGYTAEEFVELGVADIHPQQDLPHVIEQFERQLRGEIQLATDIPVKRKDGSVFYADIKSSPISFAGKTYLVGLFRDITERRQAEAKIERLNQLYEALSQCNQAIVHSTSAAELFVQICQAIVRFGGFRMAWIGMLDPATQRVSPVASAGEGAEAYLRDIRVSADAGSEHGRGPTGTAMREDRPYWCQDFLNSPYTVSWHEHAAVSGWRSSAALPVHCEGSVVGAFNLYSDVVNAFDQDVRDLLTEMSADISYALDYFSQEAKRKLAEDELRKLSLAVEQSPSSIVITDLDARLEYVNEAFVKATGYSREEAIGQNPRILHSGKTPRATYDDMWAHLMRGDIWKGELINRRKDGSEYTESILLSPVRDADGRTTHYLGIKEDITERKRVESALLESEEKFRVMSASAQDAIVMIDHHGSVSFWNRAAEKIFGYAEHEVLGKDMHQLLAPTQYHAAYRDGFAHFQQTGEGEVVGKTLELTALHKEGHELPVELSLSAVQIGGQWQAIGILRDITERKQAEALLRSSEERLQLAQMAAAVGTWEWDLASNIAQCSDSYFDILGLPSIAAPPTYAEWLGCIHPEDRDKAATEIRQAMESGTDYRSEYRIVRPDGGIRWLESKGRLKRDADGKPQSMLGAVMDITARKEIEAQVVAQYEHVAGINAQLVEANKQLEHAKSQVMQSEKMASIGLLAAGVAHEINNPVGYVNSNLGTLEKYLADIFVVLDKYEAAGELSGADNPLLEELRRLKARVDLDYLREDIKSLVAESHQGLERIKKIIRDLKDFSHSDTEDQWVWADIHHGMDSTLNVIWNELKYKCEVIKEYGDLPKIYCLPSQLNQVFMNLLVNAAQAIEVRGKITIRTGAEGDRIWVEVSDTGHGIPPEIIPRLFDPFFTTKPVGKGTGLGLSVTYNIVEKHHGKIEVQSEVGKGTTFRVWLPVQASIEKSRRN